MGWLLGSIVVAIICIIYYSFLQSTGFGVGVQGIWLVIAFLFVLAGLYMWKRHSFWAAVKGTIFEKIAMFALCIAVFCIGAFIVLEGIIIFNGFAGSKSTDFEYIIVLGAKWKPSGPSQVLKERLDTAIEYYEINPNVMFIVSGGQGHDEPISEALGMYQYLVSKGVDEHNIIMEDKSTSTNENLQFSFAMISNPDKVGVVTNNFHIFRTKMLAKKLGYTVSGIPASTKWYLLPHYYVREAGAILYEIIFNR